MNCQQANQIDMVEYLATLGFKPEKIRQNDYWFLSPNHAENTASFKVNRSKNIWYDHGTGEGGKLVDFAMRYFHCGLTEVLHKIESGNIGYSNHSFYTPVVSAFDAANSIQIIRVDQSITDMFLLRYLNRRHIDKEVAAKFCKQV
jgi:DNA primase